MSVLSVDDFEYPFIRLILDFSKNPKSIWSALVRHAPPGAILDQEMARAAWRESPSIELARGS